MLINFLLVPLTIGFVSSQEYGIWLTLSSIIAWFGISDIGFGHGLRNKFAEAVAGGNKELAKAYVSTTYFAVGILMLLLWFILFIVNFFIDWSVILNTNSTFSEELSSTVMVMITFFVLQFVVKLVGNVLVANQEPGKAAGLDFFSNCLILIFIYLLFYLKIKGGLILLAFLSGVFQIIVFSVSSIFLYNRSLKEYSPSIKYFNKKYIKDLLSLGIKFFIIQISMIFVFQCMNIIISQIIGPDAVTIYNVAYKYYTVPLTISLIIMTPLWSAFTEAYVQSDFVWMRKMIRRMMLINLALVLLIVLMFFVSDFTLELWVGKSVIVAKNVSVSMVFATIFQLLSSALMIFINGIGKIKLQVYIYIFFSVLFIPIAFLSGTKFGLTGIIYCSAFVYFIYSIIFGFQLYLIMNNKAQGLLNS